MKKLREWFLLKFLPAWAKDSVYAENQRLKEENDRLRDQLERLEIYINGMEDGMRAIRRITIRNEVNK